VVLVLRQILALQNQLNCVSLTQQKYVAKLSLSCWVLRIGTQPGKQYGSVRVQWSEIKSQRAIYLYNLRLQQQAQRSRHSCQTTYEQHLYYDAKTN
jgi:hypothetical protein